MTGREARRAAMGTLRILLERLDVTCRDFDVLGVVRIGRLQHDPDELLPVGRDRTAVLDDLPRDGTGEIAGASRRADSADESPVCGDERRVATAQEDGRESGPTLERGRSAMLRLTLFGSFTLLGADGATVVIASRKSRALLAYLALQPRPVARERLAGLLWGDGGEARARGSLRQALTTLRQEVPGDAWLETSAESAAVNRRALWVDAVAADERLRAGDAAAALELSGRGELMEGLSPGSEEFEEWRDSERRRWREREVAALGALADRARQAGDQRQVLTVGRRLLALEPWNEEAHRSVMQALAALGRRSEALRQYRLAAEALRAELGVVPDPADRSLAGADPRRADGGARYTRVGAAADRRPRAPRTSTRSDGSWRICRLRGCSRAAGRAGAGTWSSCAARREWGRPPSCGRPWRRRVVWASPSISSTRATRGRGGTQRSCAACWARSTSRRTRSPRTAWR